MNTQKETKDLLMKIRLSSRQYQMFCEGGEKTGMSWVNYMLSRATHPGLTPELLVRITELMNYAEAVVHKYAPEKASYMQKEVDELWSMLK